MSCAADARHVANCMLDLAEARSIAVSQLKLQKLLYFCQGWHLVDFGHPIITDDFEAWAYGPVVRSVRDQFRNFGRRPVTARCLFLNLRSGAYEAREYSFDKRVRSHFSFILASYGQLSPISLSEMTHFEGYAWHKTRNSKEIANLSSVISVEEIRAEFVTRARSRRIE
jgi:uncharacterized phage-associated protein